VSTVDPGRPERARRNGGARRPFTRIALVVLLAVVVFLLGVAFAQTLDERPSTGDTVTTVATLPPVPPAETVTVTVTGP
jgi:hypothetical protein